MYSLPFGMSDGCIRTIELSSCISTWKRRMCLFLQRYTQISNNYCFRYQF